MLTSKKIYDRLIEGYGQPDAQPRAYVKSTIEEILDMNLPSGYDKEIFMQKTDMLMAHFTDMAVQGYGWVSV